MKSQNNQNLKKHFPGSPILKKFLYILGALVFIPTWMFVFMSVIKMFFVSGMIFVPPKSEKIYICNIFVI